MKYLALVFAVAFCACQPRSTGPEDGSGPPPAPPVGQWRTPELFSNGGARIAAGTRLHAVALSGGTIMHRSSTDNGTTWTVPTPVPGAGSVLPLYGPLTVQGSVVHLLTKAGSTLQLQRSLDDGATWSAPIPLSGYTADAVERVQIDADGDYVHVFLGRAGATPDSSFKNYYWRSADRGETWSGVTLLSDPSGPPSPGGIAAENGTVHIAYAAIRPGVGTLGHRARYIRSTDNGATWSAPVDVSGGSTKPQIRPRPRVQDGRVMVMWEESLDHNASGPYPNATRGQIRANRSLNNGVSWLGPFDISAVTSGYPNHPEIDVGPGSLVHVAYRLSRDQATLTAADSVGYRLSTDFGATWRAQEVAVDIQGVETHPYNVVATASHVHLVVGDINFYHARRTLPEAP